MYFEFSDDDDAVADNIPAALPPQPDVFMPASALALIAHQDDEIEGTANNGENVDNEDNNGKVLSIFVDFLLMDFMFVSPASAGKIHRVIRITLSPVVVVCLKHVNIWLLLSHALMDIIQSWVIDLLIWS